MRRGGTGVNPRSIDNRMFIKTVTGVSERSQQRGNLKDEMYNRYWQNQGLLFIEFSNIDCVLFVRSSSFSIRSLGDCSV
ncbi:hypothetical protein Xsto_02713 [Xenorhabdus stockiae]|uniref:Uncharacterized protein n=1 Tax=Xenorhabdus stockiae TaxID=351614 RepID=A0A2D0KMR3_9GAMM|nr:hypothetical protein Xsto_02713 [Xenorhabdus stockiae]